MKRLLDLPLVVILMGIGALSMYLPAIHALSLHHLHVARSFFYGGTLFLVLTAMLAMATAQYRPRNAAHSHLLALFLAFALLPLMLAAPFAEALRTTSYMNAWFEMVSSFTTTGATLYEPARLPPSLHLWRAQVGWMGGFFILIAAMAILAPMNLGGYEVISTRHIGQDEAKLRQITHVADPSQRLVRYTAQLFPVYAGLTLLLWGGLLIAGESAFVALIHAMSTLSTSGISPFPDLSNAASGVWGEMMIFLFLFFAISRQTLPGAMQTGRRRGLHNDPEFRIGVLAVVVLPAFLFLRHWLVATADVAGLPHALHAYWGNMFSVLSFLSTTGFISADWAEARFWSGMQTPGLILVGLALVGGGVATTAGGVKILRVYALYRHGLREMEKLVHPHSVAGKGAIGRQLERQGAFVAWLFFMLFAISIALVMSLLALFGLEFEQATIFTIAALSTTGQLAQVAGDAPMSYAALGAGPKVILAAAMVLGRMETLALVALLAPNAWRN